MKFEKGRITKRKRYVTVLLLLIVVNAFRPGSSPDIYDLSAPVLGRTAHSVLLLWEDSYKPRYDRFDTSNLRKYFIYRNGALVDSTSKRTYTV